MESEAIEQRALAAARAVAAEQGVPCGEAVVLNSTSNVIVELRPSPVVARVMTGTVALHDDPQRWLGGEVAVLDFLAPSGLVVGPSSLIPAGPYERDGLWMTFVEAVAHRGSAGLEEGAERLGRALRQLHDELAGFPGELPGPADLKRDIERLLGQFRPTGELTVWRLESLAARLDALGETVFGTALPVQPLQGDASLSNLLRAPSGQLLWNDFEDVFRGPVHWDLAGYLIALEDAGAEVDFVAAALDAYGGIGREELAPFTAAHEVYDEIWQAYDAQRRPR